MLRFHPKLWCWSPLPPSPSPLLLHLLFSLVLSMWFCSGSEHMFLPGVFKDKGASYAGPVATSRTGVNCEPWNKT